MRSEEEIRRELATLIERNKHELDEIIKRQTYEYSEITRTMQADNRLTLRTIGTLKWVLGED